MDELTPLQDFTELVAAELLGLTKADVHEALVTRQSIAGFDPISFLAFIQAIMSMIMELINNCPQRNDRLVREAVKDSTIWQQVQLLHIVQRHANDRKAFRWRRRCREITDTLVRLGTQQSDEAIDGIIAQIREAGTAA